MAISLIGLSPRGDAGVRFFSNSWEWHALVEYFLGHESFLLNEKINLHFLSSGTELSEVECWKFLDVFAKNFDYGSELVELPQELSDYITLTSNFLSNLPDMECQSCLGSGHQRKGIISPLYFEPRVACRECDGSGKSRPYICNYELSRLTSLNFLNFLKFCGGCVVE